VSFEAAARRYARAIFEIGKEEGSLAKLTQEITSFAEVWSESAELRQALESPLLDDASSEGVLKEIGERLGLSPTAQRTVRLLGQRRRLPALPDIARELSRLVDEDAKLVRAEVLSAAPLSPDYLDRLKTEMEKATGQKVVITHRQDPSLISGVVTRIGDRVIDGSALSRLRTFRDSLTNN
jgi:F-type H+-transporting ATPase subunit delta